GKRQSTVEPVFGTLTQFMGMGKVNTLGLAQANKCMQLSAMAYNLKKYLKFVQKRSKSGATCLAFTFSLKKPLQKCIAPFLRLPNSAHAIA
ncbi:MAG: transposase, partial [Aequorivita sp.]|nr:transposase [Aequorivita sp.]